MTTTRSIKRPPLVAPGEGVTQALHAALYVTEPVQVTISTAAGADTQPAELFKVPPNTFIYDIPLLVTTAIKPDTGVSLLIGLDADSDAFYADSLVNAVGAYSMHNQASLRAGGHLTTGYQTIKAQWSTASTGGVFSARLVYRFYGEEGYSDPG